MLECRKPLQPEAGESWQSLSYVHMCCNVVYITIQWGGGERGRPRVVDHRSGATLSLRRLFAGSLISTERQSCFGCRIYFFYFSYVTSQPGQLSLAIPSWVGATSTGQKAVTS